MSTESSEGLQAPPHVASEFYLWLWYTSDNGQGSFEPEEGAPFQWWVDDRIAFRHAGDSKVTAVLTGENPSTTLEARAALVGGKALRDLRLALRREEREYSVTLRGDAVEVCQAKLPGVLKGGDEAELLYERMFLYEELHWMIGSLFRRFAEERTDPAGQAARDRRLAAWASLANRPADEA